MTEYTKQKKKDVNGKHDQCNKQSLFLGLLFFSFIPVLATAVVLQTRFKIPSMPITEYIATTFILVFIVKPTLSSSDILNILMWWFPFSSLPWLLVNTFGCLSNFSGILFFMGMQLLPFVTWTDSLVESVCFNDNHLLTFDSTQHNTQSNPADGFGSVSNLIWYLGHKGIIDRKSVWYG